MGRARARPGRAAGPRVDLRALAAGSALFAGPGHRPVLLLAGLVLGVMVLPIVAAITREIFLTVPRDQQEAAYALGATRWEMVRHAMLPWARSGIVGASALGLGRAVGETIAIALLLGNSPEHLRLAARPGRDPGERHRARVRRGQQPPARPR